MHNEKKTTTKAMSPRRCCIDGCKSASNLPGFSDVRFHAFPANVVVRKVWIENCRIVSSRSVTKSDVICSKHFVESDFQPIKNGKRLLKNGSVPTVFSWSDVKTLSDVLAEASELDTIPEVPTTDNSVDETAKSTTSTKPMKKANTRNKSLIADTLKRRSASAEEQSINDVNTKAVKCVTRKSLDSATNNAAEKASIKDSAVGKSPSKRFDAATFVSGAKVEVQDLNGSWHNACVVEVDQNEQEVLINFEKNVKAKGPTA